MSFTIIVIAAQTMVLMIQTTINHIDMTQHHPLERNNNMLAIAIIVACDINLLFEHDAFVWNF